MKDPISGCDALFIHAQEKVRATCFFLCICHICLCFLDECLAYDLVHILHLSMFIGECLVSNLAHYIVLGCYAWVLRE